MPELRFGVTDGTRYSSHWVVRASAGRPDVYVMQTATGGFLHVSLHDDPAHWHMVVQMAASDRHVRPWPRPRPLAPGYTRAVELLVTPAAIDRDPPRRPDRLWWAKAPGPGNWTSFDIFIEDAEAALTTWPGQKSMGTELVGRLPLPDGSRVCVVAWVTRGQDRRATFSVSRVERWRIRREIARGGRLRALVEGRTEDGALQLTELAVERPRSILRRLRLLLLGWWP